MHTGGGTLTVFYDTCVGVYMHIHCTYMYMNTDKHIYTQTNNYSMQVTTNACIYSGASLLRTLLGPHKVSLI